MLNSRFYLSEMVSVIIVAMFLTMFATAFPDPVNTQGPPVERNPDCLYSGKGGHVFNDCSYVCGLDQVVMAPNGSKCYIPKKQLSQTPPIPIAQQRGEEQGRNVGRCDESGACVEGMEADDTEHQETD
uniref:Putative secreted peptide n=1 Tax=Rhipicephalus pulchellus TaxID=72859 RepID=L7M8Z4_RHIPC